MNFDNDQKPLVSLVIPIRNESDTIASLIESINQQSILPDEVILVDGGSNDGTVETVSKLTLQDKRFQVIEAGNAMPGRGRNIGAENARNEWIAFTDAGIKLENMWLEELVKAINKNPSLDVIYGNYAPIRNTLFEKCAVFAYVPAQEKIGIRGKSIASALLKKKVWQIVGGFPDTRAAEDLMFMDKIEAQNFAVGYAPQAMVYWHLRPNWISTFRKFVTYSKHNVWAERQWQWHYGVAKQYLILLPFFIFGIVQSPWWLSVIFGWFCVRTAKRILRHRYEFGLLTSFNPLIFFGTMFLTLIIDLATFVGWIQAIYQKKPSDFTEIHA